MYDVPNPNKFYLSGTKLTSYRWIPFAFPRISPIWNGGRGLLTSVDSEDLMLSIINPVGVISTSVLQVPTPMKTGHHPLYPYGYVGKASALPALARGWQGLARGDNPPLPAYVESIEATVQINASKLHFE